jgi:RNA polymerase sigma-70 factor (ECF subfamily)
MDTSATHSRAKVADDDFDIVLLHASNTDAAFAILYRRHAPAVLRYAWHVAQTQAEALDLVQETFATLWDKRTSARVVDESILPWLLSVCRNHGLHAQRSRRRHETVPIDGSEFADADDPGVRDWMAEALSQLTPTDRSLCELCLLQGFTYKEAAHLLSLTETAVGKRLERARTKLRKLVLEHD